MIESENPKEDFEFRLELWLVYKFNQHAQPKTKNDYYWKPFIPYKKIQKLLYQTKQYTFE